MIRLITYDFDMTLVDSRMMARGILQDFGGDFLSITEEEFWAGTFKDVIALMYKIGGNRYSPDDLKKRVVESAIRRYKNQQLNEMETLLYLQDTGIQQAIVSQNVPPIMNACLQNENNQRIKFNPIYSCDGTTKPARIEQIISESGFPKEDSLYVGDRPEDVEAGKEVGVRTVAVPTGLHSMEELKKFNPDYPIETLAGLRDIK